MKLAKLRIENFRCCKDLTIDLGAMHALVGANNAGKSTILKALDFLFNQSVTKISEETFFARDTGGAIRVEGLFTELTPAELQLLSGYTRPDGTFHLARTASVGDGTDGGEDEDGKIVIGQEYNKPCPRYEWLVEDNISQANIKKWLADGESLTAHGVDFLPMLKGDTKVGNWKDKAKSFASSVLKSEDYEDTWSLNPKGFPSVLKACLPHFELIPAVREAAEESKVLKTNPFGRLIHGILATLEKGLRDEMTVRLTETTRRLNRDAAEERVSSVTEIENSMRDFLSEMMPADLEIQFQAPTVETLLTTPKIFVNDGFRGAIDGKGHGLQRAVIFSILRSYAKLVTRRSPEERRKLILGVEEPELYMHPTAQRTIRRVLRSIADGGDQVLFTTHSPLLVDVAYFDEIVRVESPERRPSQNSLDGAKVFQLAMERMVTDLETRHPSRVGKVSAESIRERYGHAYTPTRSEGFFAKKIILVEGQTESYCLPIYARAMKHELDTMAIAVIDCGGKDQIDRLYRVFNELGIACYVIFDFDVSSKDADTRKASKSLLRFFDDADAEPSAAHITSKFSCFREDWEKDLAPEIPDYDALIKKAGEFLGNSSKPLRARYVASRVTQGEKPLIPPTLQKIIEHAIAVEHEGSRLATKKESAQSIEHLVSKEL